MFSLSKASQNAVEWSGGEHLSIKSKLQVMLLGVSAVSILIVAALQDTLANLMAEIALLFERPLTVGDWIKVGDIEGAVVEMNWRSVRLRTLERDLMVVPNSVLGKEIITNTNQPTTLHAERIPIAPQFTERELDWTDEEVFWITKHGLKFTGMPGSAPIVARAP